MGRLLSIVVPIYNAEKYLRQCIDSIVHQTYQDKEIILVDDGSKDSSGKICEEYAGKYPFVKCIHHPVGGGCQSARNEGLDLAVGEYIAFVDSDDALDLNMYEILIKEMETNHCEVSGCCHVEEYNDFSVETVKKQREYAAPVIYSTNRNLLINWFQGGVGGGYVWNKVFVRKVLGDTRFRYDVELCEDAQFTWDVLKKVNRACFVALPMYHYRFVFTSLTKTASMDKYLKAIKVWENIKNDCDEFKITDEVMMAWLPNYVLWNLVACEKMLAAKKNDKQIYTLIQNNLKPYQNYFRCIKLRRRVLANALLRSWTAYAWRGSVYITLKEIRNRLRSRNPGNIQH